MALFTIKLDQDLPLLTQIQQVRLGDKNNQPEYTELCKFLLMWSRRGPEYGQATASDDAYLNASSDADLKLLRESCLVSQRILQSLATEKVDGEPAYDVADRHTMHNLLQKLPSYHPSLLAAGGSPEALEEQQRALALSSGLIPAHFTRYLDWTQYRSALVLAATVLQELGRLINYLEIQHHAGMSKFRPAVSVCVECRNAYVVQRYGQQYCSRRCSGRAGERRRYKEKREKSRPGLDTIKGNQYTDGQSGAKGKRSTSCKRGASSKAGTFQTGRDGRSLVDSLPRQ